MADWPVNRVPDGCNRSLAVAARSGAEAATVSGPGPGGFARMEAGPRVEIVSHWIAQYGYVGIFSLLMLGIVGLPIPDETVLAFAGYMVYRGHLSPLPTLAAALAGSICGITLSYTLGRLAGHWLLDKYGAKLHIPPERVRRMHDWFRRLGRFTLTAGYFVPGGRHVVAYLAGASQLEWPVFALFAYSGALIWSSTFIVLGYVLGERWHSASGEARLVVLIGCALVGAAGLVYWVWRRRRLPQPEHFPPQEADRGPDGDVHH